MTDEQNNGWTEHRKLVLHRLDRIEESIENVSKKLEAMDNRLIQVETRDKLWIAVLGAGGGLCAAVIPVLINYFL